MPLVNYRMVENRFTHIDAELVSCRMELPGECSYAVRFYPWWEHPSYRAAVEAGTYWSVTAKPKRGMITLTVYPRGLRECRVSAREEVVEMVFDDSHPLLWKYEDTVRVTCNSALTAEQVVALVDLVQSETRGWVDPFTILNVAGGLPGLFQYALQGSFYLGTFPLSLYPKARAYLDSIGAQLYSGGRNPLYLRTCLKSCCWTATTSLRTTLM